MKIKTLQWNIGGGKLPKDGTDPTLLQSYTDDGLDKIIEVIRSQDPDIITLQETHAAAGSSQTEKIAQALGYEYWCNDEYADSHVEEGQRLGQAIISRFPITQHSFQLFTNPHFETVWEDGSIAQSHDKGRTRCRVELSPGQNIVLQTFHTVPFRRFKIAPTSDEAKRVLSDMSSKLMTTDRGLIQADFNVDADDLNALFPELFKMGYKEAAQPDPTMVLGHVYDYILSHGIELLECHTVKDVRTDHYPLVARFVI